MIKQKENSDSKSLASFKKTSFLLAFLFTSLLTLSAADAQKDELKENLLGSEKKQKQAISTIKSSNREDLLPILSEILRTTSSEGELQGLILDLYFSYGTDIEKYNPKIIEDLEWILDNTKNEANLIKVLHYAATYKEKRLMYHTLNFITYRNRSEEHTEHTVFR